jgi:hypothetical protein
MKYILKIYFIFFNFIILFFDVKCQNVSISVNNSTLQKGKTFLPITDYGKLKKLNIIMCI